MLAFSKLQLALALTASLILTSNMSLAQDKENSESKTDQKTQTKSKKEPKRELEDRKTYTHEKFAFSLTPPKGYKFQSEPSQYATIYGWSADQRPDGTRSGILVQTLTVPSGEDKVSITAEQILTQYLAEGGKREGKMTSHEGTKELGGRKFAISDFEREFPDGTKVLGYIYVTKVEDGNDFYIMMAQEQADYRDDLDFVRKVHESFQVEKPEQKAK